MSYNNIKLAPSHVQLCTLGTWCNVASKLKTVIGIYQILILYVQERFAQVYTVHCTVLETSRCMWLNTNGSQFKPNLDWQAIYGKDYSGQIRLHYMSLMNGEKIWISSPTTQISSDDCCVLHVIHVKEHGTNFDPSPRCSERKLDVAGRSKTLAVYRSDDRRKLIKSRGDILDFMLVICAVHVANFLPNTSLLE